MEYYKIDPKNPDRKIVKRAIKVLQEGGIIVYPTNTLYGLGVDVFNQKALDRLFVLKQRGPRQPVSLLVASLEQLRSLYATVSAEQYRQLLRLLPGKYTFLLKSRFKENMPYLSSGQRDSDGEGPKAGFRIAECDLCRQLVIGLGDPITSTSANISGKPNAKTVQDIIAQFGDRLDLILDAGPTPDLRGSTIIDLTKNPYLVVREGAVTLAELRRKWTDVPFRKRKEKFRVTFVCSGNICRSAMAEGILREILSKTRFKNVVEVESAGTLPGASGPAHPLTLKTLNAHGIDMYHHQARAINAQIVEESDLLICMAVNHYEYLRAHFPQHKEKIVLLKEWHRRSKLSNPSIADPIGHDEAFYEQTFVEIQNEIKRILPYLFSEVKKFIRYNELKIEDSPIK
jgi:L-threonylcarbamoyladenylate synthase